MKKAVPVTLAAMQSGRQSAKLAASHDRSSGRTGHWELSATPQTPKPRLFRSPAVAENTRTTGWERIREIGEGVLILPDRKLPYRAGLTFDSWEVQRVEAQLGDLRFSALYMGGAR